VFTFVSAESVKTF